MAYQGSSGLEFVGGGKWFETPVAILPFDHFAILYYEIPRRPAQNFEWAFGMFSQFLIRHYALYVDLDVVALVDIRVSEFQPSE